jgi:seryl-tRNA synthetase
MSVAAVSFAEELRRHGLLAPTGVPGLYGRSAQFEDTLLRLDRLISSIGAADGPEVWRFPPVIPRAAFETSGYLKSFPHLVGTVHAFAGDERAHRTMLQAVEGGRDWSAAFEPADVVLTPAACYPVYPAVSGTVADDGRLVDVMSYCYRHEPSDDPARMQMFRMHEHVRIGAPDVVARWRETWADRAQDLMARLGLDARPEAASDPFFGRGGKLLAVNQRDQRLKMEIVAPIACDDAPTAVASLNYHQDHFGDAFGIRLADGAPAHTACVGFGLERLVLALYRAHGFDRSAWPPIVRGALQL